MKKEFENSGVIDNNAIKVMDIINKKHDEDFKNYLNNVYKKWDNKK